MTIPHLKERIEYARDELAWLEAGAKEGEEPWRGWDFAYAHMNPAQYCTCSNRLTWDAHLIYRRRPKMLHVIDAKGVRHEFPVPMREAPIDGERYWLANIYAGIASRDKWTGGVIDQSRLAFGLCQTTEEGAQQQLAALRAVCLGGDV